MGKINTDVKGLATLQQNYLDSLSDKTNDPDLSKKVNVLQDQLSSAHKAMKDADISSSHILTHQDQVNEIIGTEKERLLQKKQSIDNALIGKQRAIALNDSYQKKQAEYNKIKLAWVIALAISVLSTILQKHFEFIPSIIFNLITIIVLFGASLYSINIFIEISRREKINFNKLDLPEPAARTQSELQDAAKEKSKEEGGDLLGGMNLYGCVGQYCCNDGTKWDEKILKCVNDKDYSEKKPTNSTEKFSNMIKNSELNKRRINIDIVKENYANEYDNYAKI